MSPDLAGCEPDGGAIPPPAYRRDAVTWAAFSALAGFGFLNAVLGPALPYLRAAEHISYVVGSLHQVAFAVGGGLAGVLAVRATRRLPRAAVIRWGMVGAALAGLGVGYGNRVEVTVASALLVSLLGTSAMIRVWALLADAHGERRTVAMTEGEVAVSLVGILTPLLVAALAATALSWRFAFVTGAVGVVAGIAAAGGVRLPGPPTPGPRARRRAGSGRRPAPTLVIVFAIVGLEFALSFWLASYLDDAVGLRRGLAVNMVSALYAANLAGRLGVSRLARRSTTAGLLRGSLLLGLVGVPVLLLATNAGVALLGIVLSGAGIGATFPLTSSLHVGADAAGPDAGDADGALGEVLVAASFGQICGPLAVGAIAGVAGLRIGLLVLPALTLLALIGLLGHRRGFRPG